MMQVQKNSDWLQPPPDQQSLRRYIEAIRERIWLAIIAVAITTLAAILYVATAATVYEAEVRIVVAPIDQSEGALSSLGLIGGSGDPLRDVETASTLLVTNSAAEQTAKKLGLDQTPQSILNSLKAEPVAESNVVSITAKDDTADGAAELANTFAAAAIADRDKIVRAAIDQELPALKTRLESSPAGVATDTLAAQIAQLEALRVSGDPTLRIVEPALAPNSPVSPRPVPSILAGILAGLVLGIGAVFALRMIDPRLRREDQIRAQYRLPILARVPQERAARDQPLLWNNLLRGSIEAYRTLRAVLTGSRSNSAGATSILITSPGPGEGKTTSAISLATSLALTHKRVILIEGDLRRPTIGKAFGMSVDVGVTSVLTGDATLEESLVTARIGDEYLALLLAEVAGGGGAELLALPTAQQLVEEAKKIADVVVIDSPPLATVIDALPLARTVDEVVLVLKLGTSRMDRIQELAELLADSDVTPTGFVLIGVGGHPQPYYGDDARYAEKPRKRNVASITAAKRRSRAD
jgi:capsular exopolysaccharide synthesis family protein